MLMVLLLLCAAAAPTAAAAPKKNANVEQAVRSALVNKAFNTKILVGSYIPCPLLEQNHTQVMYRNDAIEPVDTELSPDGSIWYYARANCFYPGGMYFNSAKGHVPAIFSSAIQSGTSVWVRSVDFKDDRIEITVSANNSNAAEGSGKIKYMVGKNYRTWSADEVMEAIAKGIRIPAYEQQEQLKTQFEALRVNLVQAENKYTASGGTADSRLANAIALKQVLEQLQQNRAAYTAMGKTDPQVEKYSEKLGALGPEIAKLTDEARKDRVAQVRGQLQAQLQQLSVIQSQVRQKPPSTLAEWRHRSESLDKYSALLDARQKLFDRLQSENETPSPDDVRNLIESRAEIPVVRASLQNQQQQIELADLTAQYHGLTKERGQILDAYSRAFGTANEKAKLQQLIAVIDQIVANRGRAVALGDKTAATQLTQYRAEAEKYKKR